MYYNILKFINKNKYIFLVFLTAFLYTWDLSNLDALRQGTEGFYLQVSKEMFQKNSFLTPYYLNNPHWSKPSLHFFSPFLFYYLIPNSFVFGARLYVVVLSIITLLIYSNWIYKHFSINRILTFIFLASTIGFIKYSRIFMMEVPLMAFTSLSLMCFYTYYKKDDPFNLILAIIFGALSINIKGPVSLVMIGLSLLCFGFLKRDFSKKTILKVSYFTLPTLFIGSTWFILAYIKYGNEFIEYFFLRENVGKFQAKSYPITHIIQGLLIFSMPWSLLLGTFLSKDNVLEIKKIIKDDRYLFLFACFISCLVLWMIPSQRSHHYSIPSLPFFLFLILTLIFGPAQRIFLQSKSYNISKILLVIINFILVSILFISFYLPFIFNNFENLLIIFITLLCLVLSISFILKDASFSLIAFFHMISLNLLWSFISPMFILPTVPNHVVESLLDRPLAVTYRKPYFIEEAVGKKIVVLDEGQIKDKLISDQDNTHFLMPERVYEERKLERISVVAKRWPVWKRGNRFKKIVKAIYNQNLEKLQENLVVIKKR